MSDRSAKPCVSCAMPTSERRAFRLRAKRADEKCDRPICSRCGTPYGKDILYCRPHAEALGLTTTRILLPAREAFSLLGRISIWTLWNLMARGELIPRRIGLRVLFERRTLEEFALSNHPTGMNRNEDRLASPGIE
jgi:hypothetical protein